MNKGASACKSIQGARPLLLLEDRNSAVKLTPLRFICPFIITFAVMFPRPYKDPYVATQVLSLVAVISSFCQWIAFGQWIAGLIGVIGFIMLQFVLCCKMSRGGFATAGVFALIAAVGDFITACLLIAQDDYYYDEEQDRLIAQDGSYYYRGFLDMTRMWGALAFLACGLWIATAVCVFVFACSGRFEAASAAQHEDAKTPTAAAGHSSVDIAKKTTKNTPPPASMSVEANAAILAEEKHDEEAIPVVEAYHPCDWNQ